MNKNAKSVIVVRRRKSHKHGHHGGSWKIAYADFMTAMMAFFLVMWLLASSTPQQLHGVAEYFKMPLKAALSNGDKSSLSDSTIPGGGDDMVKQDGEIFRQTLSKLDKEKSAQNLQRALMKLESMVKSDPRLSNFQSNLRLTLTEDGLLIQILDSKDRPMFRVGSIVPEPYMRDILYSLVPVLNELPNHISLSGHTDSLPYAGGGSGYSNWELSADRANSTRRTLVTAGLSAEKFMRVTGTADIMVLENTKPTDPTNRRISLLVLSQEKEKSIRHEYLPENPEYALHDAAQIKAALEPGAPQASQSSQPKVLSPGTEKAVKTEPAVINQEQVGQNGRK